VRVLSLVRRRVRLRVFDRAFIEAKEGVNEQVRYKVIEITINTDSVKFACYVELGRETCHPDSPHRIKDSLLDERVPIEYLVSLVHGRIPQVLTARSAEKVMTLQTRYVMIERRGEEFKIVLGEGTEVQWPSSWVSISCYSRGLAEYCIELLSRGDWTSVAEKAHVKSI
jgi:hypothetical protein